MINPNGSVRDASIPTASSGNDLSDLRVLLIEDSPDNQILIRLFLTRESAKVDLASDGAEGIDLALTNDFDVVLCDMQMPNKDGHETVHELRKRGYRVPIIALTAHAMKEEYARAMANGFSDYLTKPVRKQDLVAAVQRHAQRHSK